MDDPQCIMIDVIKDVFNVEKLDGAIRDFGDFELFSVKGNVKIEMILGRRCFSQNQRHYFKDKEDHFSKKSIQFFEIGK